MIKNILSDLLIVVGILLITIGLFTFNLKEDNINNRISYLMSYVSGNTPVDYLNDNNNNNSVFATKKLDLDYNKLSINGIGSEESNYTNENLAIIDDEDPNNNLPENLRSTEFNWEKVTFSENSSLSNSSIDFRRNIFFNKDNTKIEVVIKSGFSGNKIADILSEKGVIKRDEFIRALVIFGVEKRLTSGIYTFEKDSNILDVFSKIISREVN